MQKNPFKFTGPLDPVLEKEICVSRSRELDKVISGIRKGDYWTIAGPRQIGKTTFLRQIMNELSVLDCIYIDMEVSPKSEELFYDWIINIFLERLPVTSSQNEKDKWKKFGPVLNFYYFLRSFQPIDNKNIILLFDEIEKAPSVDSFLHIWRKVFHERHDQQELKKYNVVISGEANLISLTMGLTSPFNISQNLTLNDFTDEEAANLLQVPCKKLGMQIRETALSKLISLVSGHPQLLQHFYHLLVERVLGRDKIITELDVDEACEELMTTNNNLNLLEKEIITNQIVEDLACKILKGNRIKYSAYHELAITGTGPIVKNGKYCSIRNKLYERIIQEKISENKNKNRQNIPNSDKKTGWFKNLFENVVIEILASIIIEIALAIGIVVLSKKYLSNFTINTPVLIAILLAAIILTVVLKWMKRHR